MKKNIILILALSMVACLITNRQCTTGNGDRHDVATIESQPLIQTQPPISIDTCENNDKCSPMFIRYAFNQETIPIPDGFMQFREYRLRNDKLWLQQEDSISILVQGYDCHNFVYESHAFILRPEVIRTTPDDMPVWIKDENNPDYLLVAKTILFEQIDNTLFIGITGYLFSKSAKTTCSDSDIIQNNSTSLKQCIDIKTKPVGGVLM